jgi:hypothetical protein
MKNYYLEYYKFLLLFILFNIYLIFILFSKKNINKNIIINESLFIPVYNLMDFPYNKNESILLKEKKDLLKFYSKRAKRKITEIKTIFLNFSCNFGNQLILLNKAIFFCEILGCKKIVLNKDIYWFIRNSINDTKNKMIIEIGEEKDYMNKNIIFDNTNNLFWYFKYLKPKFRPKILHKEILRNLPSIIVKPNDLYIYIRSGDIFEYFNYYRQPPLCFYQNILKNFKFTNIYIISQNKNNPVIDILIKQFPQIIFKQNSLKVDIAYLIYAYNLVFAFSTFVNWTIKYNDNIQIIWYFKYFFSWIIWSFFFELEVNKNATVYKMEDKNYYIKTDSCTTIECVKNFMLNYSCNNVFY